MDVSTLPADQGTPPSTSGTATPPAPTRACRESSGEFLRGVQRADAKGVAVFRTIYPGWYQGRTVHIHVMVHIGGNVVHTGQLYFPDAVTDAVYRRAPYTRRPSRTTRNAADSIYRNGGRRSTLKLDEERLRLRRRDHDGRPAVVASAMVPAAERERTLARIRSICLGLPEVSERLSHGAPTFFVREKRAFLMVLTDHHGDGRFAVWCAAETGAVAARRSRPRQFFVPPYVGHRGWLGVRLDRGLDWDELEGIAEDAWAEAAPPKLVDAARADR